MLTQAVGAAWDAPGTGPRIGTTLVPGRLKLRDGLARVEFYRGAVLILEGPVNLELIASDHVVCRRGKLRAYVPAPARGFTVESPGAELVNLGTEFGVTVGERTEVHVFDGMVEIRGHAPDRPAPASKRLTTDDVLSFDATGVAHPVPRPSHYVSADELAALAAAESAKRLEAWRRTSEALRRDPALLAYYTFERDPAVGDRTLADRALRGGEPHDGAIVGCRWATGRWPGKAALEFRQVSDRVQIAIPRELDSLTLMAWVQLDGLDHVLNALLMSNGIGEGGVHWQFEQSGAIKLGIQRSVNRNELRARYPGPVAFRPELKGRWLHLAVVYDRSRATVSHHVNGRRLASLPIRSDMKLRIGHAEIGNWREESSGLQPIRNLDGAIDELAILSRPLSDEEVRAHYSIGSPRE